jgi:excisionase family DNA binding protein
MTRNRRADWRRIKGKDSYTFDEAARALGVHRNTIRHWVQKCGLSAMTEKRPYLILGADLVAFLKGRRQSKKRRCGPGELYCLKCRVPRAPIPGLIEYRPATTTRGEIIGICSRCETVVHRFVSTRRAAAIAAEFNVQIAAHDGSLSDSTHPRLNCHFEGPIKP